MVVRQPKQCLHACLRNSSAHSSVPLLGFFDEPSKSAFTNFASLLERRHLSRGTPAPVPAMLSFACAGATAFFPSSRSERDAFSKSRWGGDSGSLADAAPGPPVDVTAASASPVNEFFLGGGDKTSLPPPVLLRLTVGDFFFALSGLLASPVPIQKNLCCNATVLSHERRCAPQVSDNDRLHISFAMNMLHKHDSPQTALTNRN